jgi:hypothetical protein
MNLIIGYSELSLVVRIAALKGMAAGLSASSSFFAFFSRTFFAYPALFA